MIFKYVVASTPSGDPATDFCQDVAKLLCGETDVNNLSANCDKLSSVFDPNGSIPTTYFTATIEDSTVLSRPHSDYPAMTTWMSVDTQNAGYASLSYIGDGTAGVITNRRGNGSQYYTTGLNLYNTGGASFFIGLSDTGAFLLNGATANVGTLWSEMHANPNVTAPTYNYATTPADKQRQWWVELTRDYAFGYWPVTSGTTIGTAWRTNCMMSTFMGSSGNSLPMFSMTNSSEYPLLLPDGSVGMPIYQVVTQGQRTGTSNEWGTVPPMPLFVVPGVYMSLLADTGPYKGVRFSNVSGLGDVVCIGTAGYNTYDFATLYLTGY